MTALILLSEWQKSQIEFWRKTEFDGYDVSSWGRVRSYWDARRRKGKPRSERASRRDVPVLLRPSLDGPGYQYLNFSGQGAWPKVHRLVARAFLPNPNNWPEVNHKTGIKANNWLDNLEWKTKQGNMAHAAAIGLRDDILPKGEEHYRAKITELDVRMIRQQVAGGKTRKAVSDIYGLDSSTVCDIVARRSWKHVE